MKTDERSAQGENTVRLDLSFHFWALIFMYLLQTLTSSNAYASGQCVFGQENTHAVQHQ